MSNQFSIQDSEDLIAEFRNINEGPHADLAQALRAISVLPKISNIAMPPMYPSQVAATVLPFKTVKRFGTTTLIVIALAASATLGAAALVGVPEPVVQFAKHSLQQVQRAVQTITNAVSGTKSDASVSVIQTPVETPAEPSTPVAEDLTPIAGDVQEQKPAPAQNQDNKSASQESSSIQDLPKTGPDAAPIENKSDSNDSESINSPASSNEKEQGNSNQNESTVNETTVNETTVNESENKKPVIPGVTPNKSHENNSSDTHSSSSENKEGD